jgi:hypothetical protein
MAQVEGFPDVAPADLAGTDYLYVRRSAQAEGSRDARFGFGALFRAFLGLPATAANQLLFSNGVNTLALTGFTALAQTLLGRATYVLMRGDLGFLTNTTALDFPPIAAGGKADMTINVPGAVVGDAVILGPPAAPAAGLTFDGFVSGADTVTVRAQNLSSGSVDETSMTFRAVVIKSA